MQITQADIAKMNELYLTIKTYAGVAREIGCSPSTVKKYIIPNFKKVDVSEIKRWGQYEPNRIEFDFTNPDWWTILSLTEEEKEGMKELFREIEI